MKKFFILLLITSISLPLLASKLTDPPVKLGPLKIRKRAARPDIPGTFLIELGWNILMDAPDNMDLGNFGSRTVNMLYFYDIPLGKSNFAVLPGVGLGLNKYKLDDNITLSESGGVVTVDTLSFNADKSQLAVNYFDIPLEFRFYANPSDKRRSFKVGVGVKGGIRFSSHTKIKFEDEGDNVKLKEKRSYGLNRFRYGVTGRIGIAGFNIFYYQSLSEMFDDGPEGTANTTNITVGVSFTGF